MTDIASLAASLTPPARASVYDDPPPAVAIVADAANCSTEEALTILRRLISAGYVIAPRIPSDGMLLAYFHAYGTQAWRAETIIRNIGKAKLRWQAMGQAGVAVALSRKLLDAAPTWRTDNG